MLKLCRTKMHAFKWQTLLYFELTSQLVLNKLVQNYWQILWTLFSWCIFNSSSTLIRGAKHQLCKYVNGLRMKGAPILSKWWTKRKGIGPNPVRKPFPMSLYCQKQHPRKFSYDPLPKIREVRLFLLQQRLGFRFFLVSLQKQGISWGNQTWFRRRIFVELIQN